MPQQPSIFDDPQAYDKVTIGGVECPGIVKGVDAFKTKREFDVKKGKGTFGATITFVGRPPATGSLTFLFWNKSQETAWISFRDQFKFDPTKKAINAIDIFHPWLNEIDMNSFVCEGIGAVKDEGKKLYSITVDLIEYFPPPNKNATGTPSGSTSTGGKKDPSGTSDDPIASAQQKEIASLLKEAQS